VLRIRPKEWTDLIRQLERRIHLQTPQSLYVKCPVIKFAFRALIAMNALTLPKNLLTHRDSPFPSPHAKTLNLQQNVGIRFKFESSSRGKAAAHRLTKTGHRASDNATGAKKSQQFCVCLRIVLRGEIPYKTLSEDS
jgi:hypothetical protein